LGGSNIINKDIGAENRRYIDLLRGASILRVMMVHLGLSWFYLPYSSYVGLLLPLLFFVSGTVSYFSFLRTKRMKTFVLKRLMSIMIPYYLLFIIIACASLLQDGWSLGNITYWILMQPVHHGLPFSLAQTWYLQALVIIILISMPFFYLSQRSMNYLYVLLVITFGFLCVNSFVDIHQFLIFGAIDLYLAMSNAFFFILGAVYYVNEKIFNRHKLGILMFLTLVAFSSLLYGVGGGGLEAHKVSPNLLYTSGFFVALTLLLLFQSTIQSSIERVKPISKLLKYCSTHAYSLFLLHTLTLGFVEIYIYPAKLTGDFKSAIIKMLMVIIITLLIAPFYTKLCNLCMRSLKRYI
jgi:peptidoglycan/LPS O-acetylase OafA/YrhL